MDWQEDFVKDVREFMKETRAEFKKVNEKLDTLIGQKKGEDEAAESQRADAQAKRTNRALVISYISAGAAIASVLWSIFG